MTDREKFEAEKLEIEKIKIDTESYFKVNSVRYDFTKQKYTIIMQILVVAFGFMPFVLDKLNIVPILKAIAEQPWHYLFFVILFCGSALACMILTIITFYSVIKFLKRYECYLDCIVEIIDCNVRELKNENTEEEKEKYETRAKEVFEECEKIEGSLLKKLVSIFSLMASCVVCGIILNVYIPH
ncbi:hypothetical protein FIM73_05235 [Helicobacter pylori]|uniref:hypothetical protein n=1 Tax=Helicobacter pylori TaxID=210 RepID=UPI00112829DC|nr:hypothetical protein [Helicobacter pylori]TPH46935.1 hypothetical protein FIM73_05235 [Helicobacter pylori]TPH72500.1 hypothetical protein FIM59_03475 [Helicobacter pylori]